MEYKELEVDYFSKNYKMEKSLGEGGFGATYRCVNNVDQKTYVVKVIPCIDDEDTKKKIRECVILANSKHDNLERYYCGWMEAGTPAFAEEFVHGLNNSVDASGPTKQVEYIRTIYIAMEYYPRVLKEEIRNNVTFTGEEVNNIFVGLLKALAFIHENGWLHCNFHPGNIFIDKSGNPILGDFGLSWRGDEAMILSEGNRPYQAKEVLDGHPYTPASDIFSFALCIIEILCPMKYAMEKSKIFEDAKVGKYPDKFKDSWDWISTSIKRIVVEPLPSNRLTARQILDMKTDCS